MKQIDVQAGWDGKLCKYCWKVRSIPSYHWGCTHDKKAAILQGMCVSDPCTTDDWERCPLNKKEPVYVYRWLLKVKHMNDYTLSMLYHEDTADRYGLESAGYVFVRPIPETRTRKG